MNKGVNDSIRLVDHPLAAHKLSTLRAEDTPYPVFRRTLKELSLILAVEATRDLPTREVKLKTPLKETIGKVIDREVLLVPIFRAGLGMLDGFLEIIPDAKVGFIGIYRNEHSLTPRKYYHNIPRVSQDVFAFILDPMIATGGSIRTAIELLSANDIRTITVVSVIAYSKTLEKLAEEFSPDLRLRFVTAALDQELNDKGFIVPGLGDAGDRTFGSL